jgi:glycine cleavage system T protein (aminomethyltransferase)
LAPFASTLSVLLNEHGGIIDDLVITKHSNHEFYVVTNAGRRERDLAWITDQMQLWNEGREDKVEMEVLEDWGLVALQGARATAKCRVLSLNANRPQSYGILARLNCFRLETFDIWPCGQYMH